MSTMFCLADTFFFLFPGFVHYSAARIHVDLDGWFEICREKKGGLKKTPRHFKGEWLRFNTSARLEVCRYECRSPPIEDGCSRGKLYFFIFIFNQVTPTEIQTPPLQRKPGELTVRTLRRITNCGHTVKSKIEKMVQ